MDPLTAFKQYGSTPLSYSTLQPEASYFWHSNDGSNDTNNDGYIAYFYHSLLGKCYISVLGDPIADPQQWPVLLSQFIAHYPNSSFYNISYQCYQILSTMGLTGHYIGWDVYWDPARPIHSNRSLKRCLRLQNQLSISLCKRALSSEDAPWIADITHHWVKTRLIRHEIRSFFCRPLTFHHNEQDKLCCAIIAYDANHSPIGFMVLDPLYRQGSCMGYVVNHIRYLPQYPFLTRLFLHFSSRDILSLGPVSCPDSSLFFRHNWGYSFKSIRSFRCRYSYQPVSLYFATTAQRLWLPWMAVYRSVFMKKNK
jgi:lysylphosphatidylglycerol synthetase-like protein (DUF2156 family)